MDPNLQDVVNVLGLERLEINLFRGASRDIGSPQVFGGQVLGQALRAAYGTVESDRHAHSLHAYFLRRGDVNAPIVYFVDRSRDGRSFTSRRVTAIQHGEQIFHMSASFQTVQQGFEHQIAMPQVPMPEALEERSTLSQARLDALPEKARQFFTSSKPFEFRIVPPSQQPQSPDAQPVQDYWIRAVDRLPDDEVLHRCLLAYVSDFYLLNSATLAHTDELKGRKRVMASIDHAMWFHRPLRVDEWFLCSNFSPSASGSRGFARGSVFTRDGLLAASTAQEGLIRAVEPAPPEPG